MAWISKTDAELRKAILVGEGVVHHVYLDSKGHPTIGYGHLIFRADRPGRQEKIDEFVSLCRTHGFTFRHRKSRKRATWEEVEAEILGLLSVGQAKIGQFRERMEKEHAEARFAETFLGPVARSGLTLSRAILDEEWAEYEAAKRKHGRKYLNMGAGWWSRQASLEFENPSSAERLLLLDLERVAIKPLKNGGPWSRAVGDLHPKLKGVIVDIVFKTGDAQWVRFQFCRDLRRAIDAGDWAGAAKILRSSPSWNQASRREHRAQLVLEAGRALAKKKAEGNKAESGNKAAR